MSVTSSRGTVSGCARKAQEVERVVGGQDHEVGLRETRSKPTRRAGVFAGCGCVSAQRLADSLVRKAIHLHSPLRYVSNSGTTSEVNVSGVVVTGAASGIGRASAEVLMGDGREVALWDIAPEVSAIADGLGHAERCGGLKRYWRHAGRGRRGRSSPRRNRRAGTCGGSGCRRARRRLHAGVVGRSVVL